MVISFHLYVTCTDWRGNKLWGDLVKYSPKLLKSPIQLENSTGMSSYMNLEVQ